MNPRIYYNERNSRGPQRVVLDNDCREVLRENSTVETAEISRHDVRYAPDEPKREGCATDEGY